MIILAATSTPPPVIINMPETGAPWWGVPLLAGFFLLIGSVITYLSLRASDGRKAKRDKDERIMVDTRTVGLEYLEAADTLTRLIRAQDDPSRRKHGTDFLQALASALINVQKVRGKFELFAHEDAIVAAKDLDVACVMLVVDTTQNFDPSGDLEKYENAKLLLINILRKFSGVAELKTEPLEDEAKFKLQKDMVSLLDYLEAGMTKRFVNEQEKAE